jgi:NEDD8-activating enzyme E1
VPLLANEAPFK